MTPLVRFALKHTQELLRVKTVTYTDQGVFTVEALRPDHKSGALYDASEGTLVHWTGAIDHYADEVFDGDIVSDGQNKLWVVFFDELNGQWMLKSSVPGGAEPQAFCKYSHAYARQGNIYLRKDDE